MTLPAIFTPREIRDAAATAARETLDRAWAGLFNLIESELARRRSYAFAHEKTLYHGEMASRLAATPIRILGVQRKIRRHARLAMRWGAKAHARDPKLARACGICEPTTATV